MAHLVLTVIGPDRTGLVEALAAPVAAHGGSWLESRMARLAGQFAGILRIEVPDRSAQALADALAALGERGLDVVVRTAPAAEDRPGARAMLLDVVGTDRPGIVREISRALAERGVNIEELATDRPVAAMTAETLFTARARVRVPARVDPAELRDRLERVASDLMVEVRLADDGQPAPDEAGFSPASPS